MKKLGCKIVIFIVWGLMLSCYVVTGGAAEIGEVVSPLSARDFVKLVKDKNDYIATQQLEWQISKEAVKNSRSIFEPVLALNQEHNDKTFLNEDWTRAYFSGSAQSTVVDEVTNSYTMALEGLTPIGGKLSLGYSMNQRDNDLDLIDKTENKGFVGISLVQPILKDAGVKVTKANIVVSEIDSAIAFQDYRKKNLEIIANALVAYWDLYKAQKVVAIREESCRVAGQILADNKIRVRTGKMAETEIYEAEAGVLKREALLQDAIQQQFVSSAKLRKYISESGESLEQVIEVNGESGLGDMDIDVLQSIEKAKKYRPEYLASIKKKNRENVRIAYAKNQILPTLNVSASYGQSSIENSMHRAFSKSFDSQYDTWSVGVNLSVPIFGDQKSRSELAAANHRKMQAFREMKSITVGMENDIESALKNVITTNKQFGIYTRVAGLAQKILDVEMLRLDAGKSNSRIVLEKEDDVNVAKESALNSLIYYNKSIMALSMMEGTLLIKYDVTDTEEM